MKNQPWINVGLFEDLSAGKRLEDILKDKGFECRVFDDKLFRMFLFLRPPRVTYGVQVRRGHLKAAMELLDAQPNAAVLQRAIHCPSCGSLHVQYPQMTRKFFFPTLLLHLGIIFRIIEHEAYCEHCHHTWNLPKTESPALASKPIH
ncbi:MAG TPA: hypothetical protein VE344_02920 [Methylomirabilota bacterium]|nr:hypothetical protein [Methylomirabilota bacterium]